MWAACRAAGLSLLLACTFIGTSVASRDEAVTRKLLQSASSKPGPFTDWVVAECQQPCPNLFLASWGLQCALGSDQCCLRKDSLCTSLTQWAAEATPATWVGRNYTAGVPPSPPPPPPSPVPANCTGGGKWLNASATQYWSYAPCCIDPTADQTECVKYSACEYEGLFAAYGDNKKSLSWVQKTNIAAYFEPPNWKNRKEWDRNFKNRKLRVRNPYTCKTMTVKILDTCDDKACPDPNGGEGCCTKHAKMNGARLVDLEYYTSVRFWGAPIGVDEVRRVEFQFV